MVLYVIPGIYNKIDFTLDIKHIFNAFSPLQAENINIILRSRKAIYFNIISNCQINNTFPNTRTSPKTTITFQQGAL
jgi:hypothetical protein